MDFEYHRGDEIADGFRILTVVCLQGGYAIYRIEDERYVLCVSKDLVDYWVREQWITKDFQEKYLKSIKDNGFCYITEAKYKVYTPQYGPYPDDWESAESFCRCFQNFAKKYSKKKYPNLVYIEQHDIILPLETTSARREASNRILGEWLTDGLPVEIDNIEKVQHFCDWLTEDQIISLIKQSGMGEKTIINSKEEQVQEKKKADCGQVEKLSKMRFYLPGRKNLSDIFEHQIIDFFRNRNAYERMGIKTVPAFLLYGRPGSGKTYAVEKLGEFLQFPCFEINSESVASSYIHETAKKISEVFQKAIKSAPSILIIDEIESYLSDRRGQYTHHIEEVDEFLRNIPQAIKKQVIIIGMTNHLDMIDAAVLRKGRFDQIIEVDMPNQEEIIEVLQNALQERPIAKDIRIEFYAQKLDGHPLSDVAFLVRESSRRTVRMRKEEISDSIISQVLQELCGENSDAVKRKIGFK